jgi:POT family proton-dependent oligopeptide transporter
MSSAEKTFFGHPRGLATLFFTEMWERFSYYGGRALLILYMTASPENGGLGFSVAQAGALYGLYTALVYMTNLPGGWIADKFIGAKNAVFFGGIIIALGNLLLSIPGMTTFYFGLAGVAIGTGLLKPNVSTMVGSLYKPDDVRRDSGFSIFYMGINLGAFLAPLITGFVGQKINWNLGFLTVAIGMVLGLIQYKMGAGYLAEVGNASVPENEAEAARRKRSLYTGAGALATLVAGLALLDMTGMVSVTVSGISAGVGASLLIIPIVYFVFLIAGGDFTVAEKKRLGSIFVLFLASAMFWGSFEQAGSTLNLFADRFTDNSVFGWAFPSTWWQSANAIFILMFAGVFAAGWIWMAKKGVEPSTPVKFAIGLSLVGLGFLLLVPAASWLIGAGDGAKVGPQWLLAVYFIHTLGELFVSPVGLSTITKLAPARVVGQMMGIWFLGASLGNFIGGNVGGLFESFPLNTLFLAVAATSIAAGVLMAVFSKGIRNLMGGVK